ncbi:MAG: hypothetical protein RMJ53_00120 [Chitinophagales bacterium]|nr:hypothetical protein [Chitinophagales bacterium]MDW8272618.1 hypothetical protein [Chitinophagales bacterium]
MRKWFGLLPILFKCFACKDSDLEWIASFGDKGEQVNFYRYRKQTVSGLHSSIIMKYNGRMVDYYGMYKDYSKGYEKKFPVQEKHVRQISKVCRVEYNQTLHDALSWDVWVLPSEFSPKEYEKICSILLNNKETLQTNLAYEDPYNTQYKLYISNISYFDYSQFKVDYYELDNGMHRFTVEIHPQGAVNLKVYDKMIKQTIGTNLGVLDSTGTKVLMREAWKIEGAPDLSTIKAFQDKNGKTLGSTFEWIEYESKNNGKQQ